MSFKFKITPPEPVKYSKEPIVFDADGGLYNVFSSFVSFCADSPSEGCIEEHAFASYPYSSRYLFDRHVDFMFINGILTTGEYDAIEAMWEMTPTRDMTRSVLKGKAFEALLSFFKENTRFSSDAFREYFDGLGLKPREEYEFYDADLILLTAYYLGHLSRIKADDGTTFFLRNLEDSVKMKPVLPKL